MTFLSFLPWSLERGFGDSGFQDPWEQPQSGRLVCDQASY